jgi:glucosamine--fructose-6-phosphate aminotransferase (isomerizing)
VASDVPAILSHTRDMFFLADGDMAVLTPDGVQLTDFNGRPSTARCSTSCGTPSWRKRAATSTSCSRKFLSSRAPSATPRWGAWAGNRAASFLDEMDITPKQFQSFREVKIIACGTSWHAALAGKFMIEKLARIPVEVDYGSEFRYRDPLVSSRRADRGDFAIGRNRRYAGGAARSQAERIEDAGHLQRGRGP